MEDDWDFDFGDKYHYTIDDDIVFYFKNNKLHREIGPAIFHISKKDQYFNLADKDLYKEKEFAAMTDSTMIFFVLKSYYTNKEDLTTFYIDDKEINEKEFYALLVKKELDQELKEQTITKRKKVKV